VSLGCSTTGRKFDVDSVPKIKVGVWREVDVKRTFGEPQTLKVRANESAEWRYYYQDIETQDTGMLARLGQSIARLFGRHVYVPPVGVKYETRTRHVLRVFFDAEGFVEDYTYERETMPTHQVY